MARCLPRNDILLSHQYLPICHTNLLPAILYSLPTIMASFNFVCSLVWTLPLRFVGRVQHGATGRAYGCCTCDEPKTPFVPCSLCEISRFWFNTPFYTRAACLVPLWCGHGTQQRPCYFETRQRAQHMAALPHRQNHAAPPRAAARRNDDVSASHHWWTDGHILLFGLHLPSLPFSSGIPAVGGEKSRHAWHCMDWGVYFLEVCSMACASAFFFSYICFFSCAYGSILPLCGGHQNTVLVPAIYYLPMWASPSVTCLSTVVLSC